MATPLSKELIHKWLEADDILEFAEGMNINEFVTEDCVRKIYFEDGIHYIPHGSVMTENDGVEARYIINHLQECGIDFPERK